jgi:hypothetical protein
MPIATVDSSSDRQMTLACPSLLGATVAMVVLGPSLLSYHYTDDLVATGRLSVATVTYGPLLQCLIEILNALHLT